MTRRSIALWLILASLSGVSMYLIKHEVQIRDARLDQLHRTILENQEAVLVLRAEWSYLNQPVRIESLIRRHLNLRPTETRQLTSIDAVPVSLGGGTRRAEGRK
jgi:hypothetical protein